MVVGEEQGSNIREPPTLWSSKLLSILYRRKKTASFDTVFLIVVGEELGSNIREPPTLWSSKLLSILYRRKKTASFDTVFLIVVGEEGFEPPTLWSQTRCATKLRYSPTNSFLGTLLEGSTLWSAIPNIRDALLNYAIHRQCLG